MAKITSKQIDVPAMASADANNLLQYKDDGLFVALAPPANVAVQYVSSSTGNDSNDGTRASPLKTLHRAVERLPDSTSGTIYLLEGDVFPVRSYQDGDWGTSITEIGRLISTSYKTILISCYGPQSDFFNTLAVNTPEWQTFALGTQYLNRPILEFGHFMHNGSPVGTCLVLGQNGGALVTLRAVECRWAAATRAAYTAANIPFSAIGYQSILNCPNVDMQGVILPSPLVNGSGAVLGYPVIAYGKLNPWQVYIPVESTVWLIASGCNEISFGDSGPTITGSNGTTYNTLPSTTATNFSTRIGGLVKDSNGSVRNCACNIPI